MHVRPRRRRGSLSVLFGWNLDWKPVRSNNGAVRTRQSLVVGVVYLRRFCANVMSEFEKKMKRFQANAGARPCFQNKFRAGEHSGVYLTITRGNRTAFLSMEDISEIIFLALTS